MYVCECREGGGDERERGRERYVCVGGGAQIKIACERKRVGERREGREYVCMCEWGGGRGAQIKIVCERKRVGERREGREYLCVCGGGG